MHIDSSGFKRSYLPGPHGTAETYESEIDRMIGRSKLKKAMIYLTVITIILLLLYIKLMVQ